jgi:VanZ family protein
MALIFWLSAQPDLNSGLGIVDLIGRKVVHMTEYGLLTWLWWRAVQSLPAAFVIAVAYAITDEFHQTFTSGRHGAPTDVLIDAIGAGIVCLALRRASGKQSKEAGAKA